jgi:sec-independent protein translocase protein TatA
MFTLLMVTPAEIAIVAVIALVMFGGAKIAGFGRSVGQGIRGFKEEIRSANKAPSQPPNDSNETKANAE